MIHILIRILKIAAIFVVGVIAGTNLNEWYNREVAIREGRM